MVERKIMPKVRFTPNLKQFFPTLQATEVEGSQIAEVVAAVDAQWPGLANYIIDEHGRLRPHVNIFIGEDMIDDRVGLSDAVTTSDTVFFFQALSGG